MTLNDPDRLFGVKFCFRAGLAGSDRSTLDNNCVKTNKDDVSIKGELVAQRCQLRCRSI